MRALSTLLSVLMLVTAMGPVSVAGADDSKSNDGGGSKSSSAKLVVPLTGTVTGGGTFTGSFSIVRFENRNGTIHAVGMISGVASGALARSGISGPHGAAGDGDDQLVAGHPKRGGRPGGEPATCSTSRSQASRSTCSGSA